MYFFLDYVGGVRGVKKEGRDNASQHMFRMSFFLNPFSNPLGVKGLRFNRLKNPLKGAKGLSEFLRTINTLT